MDIDIGDLASATLGIDGKYIMIELVAFTGTRENPAGDRRDRGQWFRYKRRQMST